MDYDQKISQQFNSWTLKVSTASCPKNIIHFYADYAELLAIYNNTRISEDDLLDRFQDEGIIVNGVRSDNNENADDLDCNRGERNDQDWVWVNDIFTSIAERSFTLGNDYPFIYSYVNEAHHIELKKPLNIKQHIYLFLLLCSSLSSFNKSIGSILTTDFEKICKEALKSLFAYNNLEIFSMGKDPDLIGSALSKIEQLAVKLGAELKTKFVNEEDIKGSQEKGLDIVLWLPFKDDVPNHLTILAQCTCQKEWYKKVNDAKTYDNFYELYLQQFINALLIPFYISRNSKRKFWQHTSIQSKNILILGRQRLLELMKSEFIFDYPSMKVLQKSIEYEEPLI